MKRILVIAIGASLSVAAFGAYASAQLGESPSQSKSVPGPAIGPSGQTGDLHYFENPAKEFDGTSEKFGPYRLLPLGTKFIPRAYPDDKAPRDFSETKDSVLLSASKAHVLRPTGFVETNLSGTLRNGAPIVLSATWISGKRTVTVASAPVQQWALPIDVYLHFPDSLIAVKPVMIGGWPGIVTRPTSGPVAGIGSVQIWLDGIEVVFTSADLNRDEVTAIAEAVVTEAKRGRP